MGKQINYFSEYHKNINKAEDLIEFIQDGVIINEDKIPALLKVQRQLGVIKSEMNTLKEQQLAFQLSIYSSELTHTNDKVYYLYSNKATGMSYYYDKDGYQVDESDYEDDDDKGKYLHKLGTKNSEGMVYLGINVLRALAVYGYYKIKVSADNQRVAKVMQHYVIINLFNKDEQFILDGDGKVTKTYVTDSSDSIFEHSRFANVLANFVKIFYKVDYIPSVSENAIYKAMKTKNFELVIKTASKWFCDYYFENRNGRIRYGGGSSEDKVNHMSKVFGVTKDVYDTYKDRPSELAMAVFLIREKGCSKHLANEVIEKIEAMTIEFELFGKQMNNYINSDWYVQRSVYSLDRVLDEATKHRKIHQWDVFYRLVERYYSDRDKIKDTYTLMQYLQYARDAIIDQGFNSVSAFVSQITDYIRFNYEDDSKAVVKPDYLRRVHDVYVANRKIHVSEEDNVKFVARYENDKDWVKEYTSKEIKAYVEEYGEEPTVDLMVKYPKDAGDLKLEGNLLNHCVGGYIPRVITGELKIYFLRRIEYPEEPFITVEVRKGKVTQARGATNLEANSKVMKYLHEWEKTLKTSDGEDN